jgi:hypothetical protein
MTEQRNYSSPSTALGLGLSMGCLMAVVAFASLFVGLAIDRAVSDRSRIATLVCVLGGLPLNLSFAVWLAQRLARRMIPIPEKRTEAGAFTPSQAEAAPEDGETPSEDVQR